MTSTLDVPLSEITDPETSAGVGSVFVKPQSLAPTIDAISVVMMMWALSFVMIRLYANTQASRRLRIEDYFCITALILAFSDTGLILSFNKFARHDSEIPLIWINSTFWRLNYAETMLLGPTLFFAKGAILLLYLRIFTVNKKMRYSIWFGLIWDFLLYWSSIPITTYYCSPRIGQPWDVVAVTGASPNLTTFLMVQGVLSATLDLYIFILPVPIVLKLRIPLQQRLSILGVFGTGILGITAAVVGMVFRIKLYVDIDDCYWKTAQIYICIICENHVAIIVSSMPAVASVSRGKTSLPSWLASMRCRFSKSISRLSTSRTRSSVSDQSGAGGRPLLDGGVMAGPHTLDGAYLQVYEGRQEGDYELGLVTPEIRGAVDGRRIQEEGICGIRKSVEIRQTTGLARPNA